MTKNVTYERFILNYAHNLLPPPPPPPPRRIINVVTLDFFLKGIMIVHEAKIKIKDFQYPFLYNLLDDKL